MGPNNVVIGWTPVVNGFCIVPGDTPLTISPATVHRAGRGGNVRGNPFKERRFRLLFPDGKKLAYNYIFREFRAWKRYQGGMADDIRVFDFNTKKSERITDNVR